MSTFQLSVILSRFLGLYLVLGRTVPGLAEGAVWLCKVMAGGQMGGMPDGYLLWQVLPEVGFWVATGVIGYFLVFRATMFARILCRGVYAEGHCQRCGYNLAASALSKCPECGDTAAPAV